MSDELEQEQSERQKFLKSLPKAEIAQAAYNALADRMNDVSKIVFVFEELEIFSKYWNDRILKTWLKFNAEFGIEVLRAFHARAFAAGNTTCVETINKDIDRMLSMKELHDEL
jgi:hypothetical protein